MSDDKGLQTPVKGENIVLLHGLYNSPVAMLYLKYQLKKLGYNVYTPFYRTITRDLEQNAQAVHERIAQLGLQQCHLIGHSLGGLLIMHLLEQHPVPQGKVIMLSSPINGSFIAERNSEVPLFSTLISKSMRRGLSGVDVPQWNNNRDWGVIAGSSPWSYTQLLFPFSSGEKHDGTVMHTEMMHPDQRDKIELNSSHTGMIFNKNTVLQIHHFLQHSEFKHSKT